MTFKTFFTYRKPAAQGGETDDAGMIVVMMMALVFVPIVVAHAASMWHGPLLPQQIAGLFSVVLNTF